MSLRSDASLRFWQGLARPLIFGAMVLLAFGCSKNDPDNISTEAVSRLFGSKITDVSGKNYDFSALRGKTLVVNFWATWCPPCVEEMPLFSEAQTRWKEKGVVFVGIATDQADKVRSFVRNSPVNYPILIGGQTGFDLSRELGNRHGGIPFTVIIDAHGRIAKQHTGLYTRKALEADLARVVP